MDLLELGYNDHTLFHMIRHFQNININARVCLNGRGYTPEVIDENLKMTGSKFHKNFATDIKTLVEQIKKGKIASSQERKKYQEIIIEYDQIQFPNGIGTLGICNRNELDTWNASIPILKMNRGVQLWHATVSQMPITHQLTIVIKKQTTSNFLITAFPGLPVYPLPQKWMKTLELEAAKKYWWDKVFLERR